MLLEAIEEEAILPLKDRGWRAALTATATTITEPLLVPNNAILERGRVGVAQLLREVGVDFHTPNAASAVGEHSRILRHVLQQGQQGVECFAEDFCVQRNCILERP